MESAELAEVEAGDRLCHIIVSVIEQKDKLSAGEESLLDESEVIALEPLYVFFPELLGVARPPVELVSDDLFVVLFERGEDPVVSLEHFCQVLEVFLEDFILDVFSQLVVDHFEQVVVDHELDAVFPLGQVLVRPVLR